MEIIISGGNVQRLPLLQVWSFLSFGNANARNQFHTLYILIYRRTIDSERQDTCWQDTDSISLCVSGDINSLTMEMFFTVGFFFLAPARKKMNEHEGFHK